MLRKSLKMRLKPRFHAIFFIYLFFGGIWTAALIYIFSFQIGKKTEFNYLKVVDTEIVDTIVNIGDLPSKEYAYTHGGTVQYLELKNRKDLKIPLYLESYQNKSKIIVGERITKTQNSRIIQVYAESGRFTIELKNLVKLRKQSGRIDAIIWIVAYLVIAIILLFYNPFQTNKNNKKAPKNTHYNTQYKKLD